MAATMKAAVLYDVRDLRIEQVPRPQITEPDQVLVKIDAVGICGSDIHWYEQCRIGMVVVTDPLILGHESAGEVLEVGEEVVGLKPGDRVAIEPGRTCRRCEYCKSGRYNLCRDLPFLGTPPVDGAFCQYLAWPYDFLFKLPDELSLEEGAMMEPMAVGMHAVRLTGVRVGDTVVVIGAGPIGLTTLQAAKAHGATQIIVSDVVPFRLAAAQKLGATDVINAAQADVPEAVKELTNGRGVDAAFECVGLSQTISDAIKSARPGGRVQLVGVGPESVDDFPIWSVMENELTITGLFRYANAYPPAIAAAQAGIVDVKSLITHRFSLDELPEAIAWVSDHKSAVIKAVVVP